MSFRTDDELILDYGRRGDTAAFDELYQRYRKPLFGFMRQQMPELAANNAFDLCWEAVIQLASSYMPAASFRSYLYTIARRRVTDYWSSQAQQGRHFQPEGDKEPLDEKDALLVCVGQLSEKQLDAFLLKQTGLAQAEIGLMLGSSFETIKSCLTETYNSLKECWETQPTDEQIETSYQAAISEFEPWERVDAKVKQLAHLQVQRSHDWAAFPSWGRLASLAGIAVLAWWLWSTLQHDTVLDHSAKPASEAVPILAQEEGAPAQLYGHVADKQSTSSIHTEEIDDISEQKIEKSMQQLANRQPLARPVKCLQLALQQRDELLELSLEKGLPDGITRKQISLAESVIWHHQKWQLVNQQRWYLVRNTDSGWLHVALPESLVAQCFL